MGKTFSIADAFQNVPNSGTEKMQITYIPFDLLKVNDLNFYSVNAIEELAADLQTVGLQQPLVVLPDDDGKYLIISGHRRRAAIELLRSDDPDQWREIPCIIENHPNDSESMRELRLIFANMDTRKMSGADIDRQAQRVQELLYQLKENEGVEFPGRMRDYVAEACQISKSKLSRLKVIREGLEPSIFKRWWDSKKDVRLSEDAAVALAKLPHDLQLEIVDKYTHRKNYYGHGLIYLYADTIRNIADRVQKLEKQKCAMGGPCDNRADKRAHIIEIGVDNRYTAPYCDEYCCGKCPGLASCKIVCSHQISTQKALKDKNRAERKAEKEAEAARVAPKVEKIRQFWERFGAVRKNAGISADAYKRAIKRDYMPMNENDFEQRERGEKITDGSILPVGYNFNLSDAECLIAAADVLHCSLDYLFGRSNYSLTVEELAASTQPIGQTMIAGWMPGGTNPGHSCQCVVEFDLDGDGGSHRMFADWNATLGRWEFSRSGPSIDMEPIRWMELPEVE